MKSKREKKEAWVKRFDDIQEEWKKHETMNTCSVCDSPKGHTTIESFFTQELAKERERVIKEYKKKIDDLENKLYDCEDFADRFR